MGMAASSAALMMTVITTAPACTMTAVIVKKPESRMRDMSSNSRASMVRTAAALFGSRGLPATSFSDVLAASGAPRGSIYHHFPGGKKQLAQDAIAWTSEQVLGHLRACPADTPAGVLAWFVDLWRQSALASGGSSGCPVAGVALDTGSAAA